MKFYGFIRGVDEFGRKTINTHEAEYTLIAIEPKVGDLMLFIDPKSRTSMTYIVKEEYPAPWNKPDDMPIFEGKMEKYFGTIANNNVGINQWLSDHGAQYPSIVNEVIKFANKALN